MTRFPRRAYRFRVTVSSLFVLALLGGAADPDVAAAESAFDEAHYEDVLPAVRRALQHPLSDADKKRAFELEAFTQAAFDERSGSVEAFRHVLGLDPAYEPDPSTGPKVRAYWEHARKLGPLGRPPPHVEDAPRVPPPVVPKPDISAVFKPPPPQVREEPLYERWYVWAGAGAAVIAAGVVVGVAVMDKPQVPAGNLGTGTLR